jgi:vancomycin permeability regulator SanA
MPPLPEPEPTPEVTEAPAWLAISRGAAFFLGVYTLIGVFGELRHPGFDASLWWVDLRPLPTPAARGVLSLGGVLFIGFAARPQMASFRRRLTFVVAFGLFAASLWNALAFYTQWRKGQIVSGFPVPFSLHVAAALAVVVAGVVTHFEANSRPMRTLFLFLLTVVVCAAGFPLAQMYCFGMTDHRRQADVAVVFGCGVRDDGLPSAALSDRIAAGCELYKAGLVRKLVFSGGSREGAESEPEVMRREAVGLGVPESDLILDAKGVDTQETVDNTVAIFRDRGLREVLVVSHFYHLPRIKLAYHRAGVEVSTVPARQQQPLQDLPRYQAREVLATWLYYVRPLLEKE